MALFDIQWLSESIKKRALRYLLQRYLGNFLLEKLSLDQLSLDLYNGKGSIRNILLDVDTIDEELNQWTSFKFIDGSIDELSVFVPWSSLLTDSCFIHFDGISFNVCKLFNKKQNDFRESTVISKSLMTSSMQIAEEIVNEETEKFDGLEMFAQLIDSVLRRFQLSASNTSFKFVYPRKTGDGQEIQMRIKYIKCEEEEQIGEHDKSDQNSSIVSETITKIISLEGIEILINDVLICKMNGKHSIKLKIDENKSDLQIFLGSHIFSIMTSKHLETLIAFFECGEQMPLEMPLTGEKMMNSEDYLRVEQQLQSDAGYVKAANHSVISSSSVTINSNKWTTSGLIEEEPNFLPLKTIFEGKESKNIAENTPKKSQFSCHIKIPGLILCLISSDHSMPHLEGMPIIDCNSFSRINPCLDQLLDGYNHVRLLSQRLLFDINSDSFLMTCGDLMFSEVVDNTMTTILCNELNNQLIVSPLFRFKMKDNLMFLNLSSICVKLDPTFLERYYKYFNINSRKTNSQMHRDFNLEVNCDDIKLELLFPIPDLRPEKERASSQLRDESLLIKLANTTINYNSNGGQIKCKSLGIEFQVSNIYTNILNANSFDSKLICLKFRIGINGTLNTTLSEADVLFEAEMEDSIYMGQTGPQVVTEPFQVKRKVIGRGGDENEQVLTPGDRQHLNKYMETSASSAQLYFELFVPTVDIHFQNKEQFELLYNRIGNDLILWTPLQNSAMHSNIVKESISQNAAFFSCKAGMSDSFESTNSSFHSFIGSSQNSRINLMTFIFHIKDITFEMGSKAEHIQTIFSQNLMVGVVVGAQDDPNSTICICGENLSLKSDNSVIISGNVYSEPNCGLNIAININRESDTLKKIKLALQLSCAAMYEIQIDVFEQLWRFINVEDEPVIGYIPPKVITELHIDLVDSAIALENITNRPALITFEDIYLTSMVVENTNQTLLRIFAEETLFCFKRNKTALETMKNYICVVHSGIIDLNLRLGKDGKLEFKLSNNAIDIRVCSDSFSALCQLISSLTSSSSPNVEVECKSTENISFQDSLDGNLIEDALGEHYEQNSESGDSDEEPPKFCSCESPKLDESGFWILGDDDLGTGIKMTSEPQIRVLTSEPVKVVENHFNISRYRIIPEISPSTISRYLLEEMTLILHLYDGRDFDDDINCETYVDKRTEDSKSYKSGKSFSASEPRVRFSEGSVHIWENIDLVSAPISLRGANSGHNIGATNTFKSIGGSKRQYETCVQLYLAKVKTLFENFETDFPVSWRFLFMVQDIEIIDRVTASKIKKMLYEYCSESMPRRKHTNMISIKATAFRNPNENSEECDLKISVKPLRVNIDQDTLLFLGEFFSTVIATISSEEPENGVNPLANIQINNNLPTYDDVMPFDDSQSNNSDATHETTTTTTTNSSTTTTRNVAHFSSNSNKVFIKSFAFSPEVLIRLDYHGKHVDFDRGALRGLCLGLGQLNQSELRLKRLNNKHGILGIDKVLTYAINEWTKDIKRNQLPSLLGGVGPMHSFIQLFQGIKDLIWMPIDQYRRDRRLVRGLQRGASSFSASTAMATLDLANRFVSLIQSAAQFAHDVVTPPTPGHRQQTIAAMNAQPRDLREGVAAAYVVIREGLHDTVRGVANAGYAADDMSGAIGEVVRQIPSTLVRPLIHASQATSNVLVGMRNQLTPEARKDDHDKWKNATDR